MCHVAGNREKDQEDDEPLPTVRGKGECHEPYEKSGGRAPGVKDVRFPSAQSQSAAHDGSNEDGRGI
jgi:hypothetical protein